jgi:hypothetical protein
MVLKRRDKTDIGFDVVNTVILLLFTIICIYRFITYLFIP